jgi:hypothetical protein
MRASRRFHRRWARTSRPPPAQILTIVNNKSAEGLSVISFELEILGFLVAGAYGYVLQLPFSAYGEAMILLLQSLVLVGAVYHYAKVPLARRMTTTALFAGALGYLTSGAAPGTAAVCLAPRGAAPGAAAALLAPARCVADQPAAFAPPPHAAGWAARPPAQPPPARSHPMQATSTLSWCRSCTWPTTWSSWLPGCRRSYPTSPPRTPDR